MRNTRSWAFLVTLFACQISPGFLLAQDLQLPSDYALDLELAEAGRSKFMAGHAEISGTAANQTGEEVFHQLIGAGYSQPYSWKMTIVDNHVLNAGSTAGGKVYVYGGLASLIGQNRGLWAAVLSHEVAHTGRRHQVAVYMRRLYIQKTIQYYRARVAAGDKSANWSLIAFTASSAIALKKFERDQEHEADQQGMLIMARAGYHPDNVFALHHLLLMRTGEQSKFAAFFSDHPRWETRDQRSDKVYGDAVAEFNRLWPDAASSPGGAPPVVAFLGQPEAKMNKQDGTADVTIPVYCRNTMDKVDLVLAFNKDNHPVAAVDSQYAGQDGGLAFHEKVDCLETGTNSIVLRVPASAVSSHDRSVKAAAYVESDGQTIAGSTAFDVRFPDFKRTAIAPTLVAAKPVFQKSTPEVSNASMERGTEANSGDRALMTQRAVENAGPSSKQSSAPSTMTEEEGSLTITSANEGAEIFLDSVGRGKTPATLKVKPGKHSVQVVKEGHQDWVQDVSVGVGENASVNADFSPRVPIHIPESAPVSEVRVTIADAPPVDRAFAPSSELTKVHVQENSVVSPAPVVDTPNGSGKSDGSEGIGGIGVAAITGAYGVIITDLVSDGPAVEAGMKIGDTVIAIDDKSVKTTQMMDAAIRRLSGSTTKISYIRNGIAGEAIVSVRNRSILKSQL
jgi:PEGA domain/Peptidase family M48/PDZ domain